MRRKVRRRSMLSTIVSIYVQINLIDSSNDLLETKYQAEGLIYACVLALDSAS